MTNNMVGFVLFIVFNATFNNISAIGFELTTLVVINTGCAGSCKSNYHMIMTAPENNSTYSDYQIILIAHLNGKPDLLLYT